MKIGYGINRDPWTLRDAGAERVWIDTDASARMERADLFSTALGQGDTLILLARSDLGIGREIARFEALADRAGARIEVVGVSEPEERRTPGPARAFQPTPRQRARIAHYWYGPFKASEVLRMASEIMGRKVSRNSLNKALGPRSGQGKETRR